MTGEIAELKEHIDLRFSEVNGRIDALTVQVTTTNGSVRALQQWRSYMEGLKAGAGGSYGVLIGAAGVLIGVGALAFNIVLGLTR